MMHIVQNTLGLVFNRLQHFGRCITLLAWFALFSLTSASANADAPTLHHNLKVTLDPATHSLNAQDTIDLPNADGKESTWVFLLHDGLKVTGPTGTVTKSLPGNGHDSESVPIQRVSVRVPASSRSITLKYSGKIDHSIGATNIADVSAISDSPGFIGPDGAYLSDAARWYPQLEGGLVTFTLQVSTRPDWTSVSQGARTQNEHNKDATSVTWNETNPQEGIYLVAAPFVEYTAKAGTIESMVFLRTADTALAKQYLDATERYITLFSKLLGPYPYAKFALVENTWETGFGMPSFTLLGSKVIRLPFIITSSYPHEILHNWWGNGVYVDYETGNWAEGLTAYLADQFLREQRGEGANARRNSLQNYTDSVSSEQEFPLSKFTARHNSSSAAIGYGKAQMVFHMLRLELGDRVFSAGLRALYEQNRFKKTRYSDVERAFSEASRRSLKPFFVQWVERAGAPALKVRGASTILAKGQHLLRLTLEQSQTELPLGMRIPVIVTLKGEENTHQTFVLMSEKTQSFILKLPGEPLRVDIDPEYDVFRRLDRGEIPPALSQAFGARKATIVLPSRAPADLLAAYQTLAQSWKAGSEGTVDIKLDSELKQLPKDRSVWVIGWENTWTSALTSPLQTLDARLESDSITLGTNVLERAKNAVAVTARRDSNSDQSITFVGCDNVRAVPGLTNKLPHYRSYSYVAFEGDAPTNKLKGQWNTDMSPMTIILDNKNETVSRGKLAARPALVD